MTDATFSITAERARRLARDRGTLEAVVEAMIRPGNWGARVAYAFGLQGRLRTSTLSVDFSTTKAASRCPSQPLRIAFASDFHAGGLTDDRMLEQACAALATLNPDILLLGGDFVAVRAEDVRRITPLLEAIPAPLGKLAVLGNHDLRAGSGKIISALEHAGIRLITNQHVTVRAQFGSVSISGLDDTTRGWPRGDLALDEANADRRVVLMHSPEGLESIGDRHFDLALCGHTHGGQISLPWGTPIFMPGGPLNRQYSRGNHTLVGDRPRMLLVSRGVGCSSFPVRLFAAPEVHLCLIT